MLATGKVTANDGGLIRATPRYMTDALGLTGEQQEQMLDRLVARGIVEIEYHAGQRHICIDTDRLDAVVTEALGEGIA